MNVIVLEADGLHLGYLGCYGAEGAVTPALDRLAAEGVVFDQHLADCLGTTARTAWTGRFEFPENDSASVASPPALPTLPGVATAFVPAAAAPLDLGDRLAETLKAARAALRRVRRSACWFVWVELPSLAPPWEVTEDDADDDEGARPWVDPPVGSAVALDDEEFTRLQDTYAAVVELFDAEIGRWRDQLDEKGWLDQALLCVTVRRGLALAEHGVIGSDLLGPHEELVHLPLLLHLPDASQPGRRVGALTQSADLLPTLLEALGVAVPPDLHGRGLWPLLRGEAEQLRPYAVAGTGPPGGGWLLRTPEWALLRPPAADEPPTLYRKPDDRWEVNNLVQHYQPWAEHLEETLRAFLTATRQPGPLCVPPLRELDAVLDAAARTAETDPSPGGSDS